MIAVRHLTALLALALPLALAAPASAASPDRHHHRAHARTATYEVRPGHHAHRLFRTAREPQTHLAQRHRRAAIRRG